MEEKVIKNCVLVFRESNLKYPCPNCAFENNCPNKFKFIKEDFDCTGGFFRIRPKENIVKRFFRYFDLNYRMNNIKE